MNQIHPWQEDPKIIQKLYTSQIPKWSLVMPIFNQEKKLGEVLRKIIRNASSSFEMILIDDGSEDASIQVVNNLIQELQEIPHGKVVSVTLIHNRVPIYETACDNQGFRLARAKYIIEIQADIQVEEPGFDEKMIRALNQYSLGAVSGRHVHAFSMLEGRRAWFKYPVKLALWRIFGLGSSEGVGRLGSKIFERMNELDKYCYIGETVARGPWLLRKSDLEKYGYLDEENFYLGNDDHDLHRRMFLGEGKMVAYVPLRIYSIPEDGSTRRVRSGINQKVHDYLKTRKKGSPEFRRFMRWYRPYCKIRKLPLN